MKHNIPQVKGRNFNVSFVRVVDQIHYERYKIRRVQTRDTPFPEGKEVDDRFVNTRCARPGPIQVNTKTGDDEEEIYSGVREMNYVTGDLRQPPFPAAGRRQPRDSKRVISHNGQCRPSAHRVKGQHATDSRIFPESIHSGHTLEYPDDDDVGDLCVRCNRQITGGQHGN